MEQRRVHKIIRGTQLSFVLEAFLKFLFCPSPHLLSANFGESIENILDINSEIHLNSS